LSDSREIGVKDNNSTSKRKTDLTLVEFIDMMNDYTSFNDTASLYKELGLTQTERILDGFKFIIRKKVFKFQKEHLEIYLIFSIKESDDWVRYVLKTEFKDTESVEYFVNKYHLIKR